MPHLLNVWPSVSSKLLAADRVLLVCDYDGTLTPIVARPETAILTEKTRCLLSILANMDRFVVGVISGRSLPDLESVVAVPGLVYAGNDGLEISGLGVDFVHCGASDFSDSLSEIARKLQQELSDVPEIVIDNKRLILTVHFRNTPDHYSAQVDEMLIATVKPYVESGQMKITRGTNVAEIMPNISWGKGRAIEQIRRGCGDNPIPIFFGDDQMDEDGFVAVQNVGGVAVYIGGTRQNTTALHQLESPTEVEQALTLLTQL